MMPIHRDLALKDFQRTLANIQKGGTTIREVRSFPIVNYGGLERAIKTVGPGVVIWQHTPTYHVAAIKIAKGQGYGYSRDILDLIYAGIDTEQGFLEAWEQTNGTKIRGQIPKIKGAGSITANTRKKQASYITVNMDIPANPHATVKGSLPRMNVDRTHLISSQVTGIENHRGLLIDFDGWLNEVPMNDYETRMLRVSNTQDLIWVAIILNRGPHIEWHYMMLNDDFTVYSKASWLDDRWTYIWRYDHGQEKIPTQL